jgi:hypothetical protein
MIATTISSSISVKPFCLRITGVLLGIPLAQWRYHEAGAR